MGGYQVQFYATQHPERIEKLFCIDPAGTEPLDPAKNDPDNMMHGDECWRRYTKEEVKKDIENQKSFKKHMMQDLHDSPGCIKDMAMGAITPWLHADMKS